MKIAVPTKNGNVDYHFGHCDHYTVYTVENNLIVSTEDLASPEGCGCKSGIASDLQRIGVTVMLAGSMGEGALSKLSAHGMEVVRGCKGNAEQLVLSYLRGEVKDSGIGCTSHDEHHHCDGHNHNHEHSHAHGECSKN